MDDESEVDSDCEYELEDEELAEEDVDEVVAMEDGEDDKALDERVLDDGTLEVGPLDVVSLEVEPLDDAELEGGALDVGALDDAELDGGALEDAEVDVSALDEGDLDEVLEVDESSAVEEGGADDLDEVDSGGALDVGSDEGSAVKEDCADDLDEVDSRGALDVRSDEGSVVEEGGADDRDEVDSGGALDVGSEVDVLDLVGIREVEVGSGGVLEDVGSDEDVDGASLVLPDDSLDSLDVGRLVFGELDVSEAILLVDAPLVVVASSVVVREVVVGLESLVDPSLVEGGFDMDETEDMSAGAPVSPCDASVCRLASVVLVMAARERVVVADDEPLLRSSWSAWGAGATARAEESESTFPARRNQGASRRERRVIGMSAEGCTVSTQRERCGRE